MAYTTIDDPSAHFYSYAFSKSSGTGSATFDGNSDLQPDFLWVKSRNNAESYELWDSTRGVNSTLFSDNTSAEDTAANRIVSFDTDGFTWGNAGNLNAAGNFVSWAWKANGGTTSSNTDGTITSTVQANTDAGFSIVTYNGSNDSTQTIGHGLGQRPDVVMVKRRTDTGSFIVWTSSLTSGAFLQLAVTNAEFVQSRIYQAGMTTTTIGIGSNNTTSVFGNTYVAYCFAEKQGYSKFGKYTGNGNANGTFVYTGFKPAFLIMKRTDSSGAWHIFDNKRLGYNINNNVLQPDVPDAELAGADYPFVDILSNGFKTRRATFDPNVSGATYIYMAFAENPFVTSTGVPTTAR